MTWQVLEGDVRDRLADLEDESVQTCVTSPPYWGLRDYGVDGQLGLEPTPEQYVANLVAVFREVRRVLRDDGTLWLNLGDSYTGARGGAQGKNGQMADRMAAAMGVRERGFDRYVEGLPAKNLVGIPWRVALALQADGWWLRSEIIWSKGACKPESVTDRPTVSHETLFLLARSSRYFYDADAVREPSVSPGQEVHNQRYARVYDGPGTDPANGQPGNVNNAGIHSRPGPGGRNKRTVWHVNPVPSSRLHFAAFPPKLIEPCILAGSAKGDTILDPFAGAGTTLLVAEQHGRDSIGIELNLEYAEMARERIRRWEANPNGHLSGDPEPVAGQTSLLEPAHPDSERERVR